MSQTALRRVPVESQTRLRGLMRDYFVDLDAAAKDTDRRVAWCTSVGPTEILTAFGFDVFFPENHGALLGAQKVSHTMIPRAVGAGYCPETCSYMNSDIGASLSGWSPLQDIYGVDGPPTPDLLTYNTNQCREVQDWFRFFSKRHDAAILGVRPPLYLGEVTDEHVSFVKGQLRELIGEIERQFGLKLDEAKLEESVAKSSKASSLWREILDTARRRPAPLSFWDVLILMAPVILMRGSDVAIEFYEQLLAEMNQRLVDGVAAVPGERFRVYWEGMPVWPRMRELSEKFFDLQTGVVASTYCNSWAFTEYVGGDPLDWMARTSLEIFINRDEVYKQQFLTEMFDSFSIDGVIFHNARTCPNNTNSRFGMAQRVREELNLPVLVLDGDLTDIRFFSTAQSMTNIEAFIEQLEGRQ